MKQIEFIFYHLIYMESIWIFRDATGCSRETLPLFASKTFTFQKQIKQKNYAFSIRPAKSQEPNPPLLRFSAV